MEQRSSFDIESQRRTRILSNKLTKRQLPSHDPVPRIGNRILCETSPDRAASSRDFAAHGFCQHSGAREEDVAFRSTCLIEIEIQGKKILEIEPASVVVDGRQ